MNGKELLLHVVDLQKEVDKITAHIKRLKSTLTSTGISYDKERIQISTDPDKISTVYAEIDEQEREKEALQKKCVEAKLKAVKMINTLDQELHKSVLHLKYIEGCSFKGIAKEIEYSYEYIVEVHGHALKAIENILCESY